MRAVVLLQLGDHPLLQPTGQLDSAVFVDLGRRVAGGDLTLATATGGEPFFLAPLYAYFLGLVFVLTGGSVLAAKLLQAGLGAAAVVLVVVAARPWVGKPAALVAGTLLAVCGPVVFHETLLLQTALDPFLIALALVAVSRALVRQRGLDWLLAGAAVGLFALNRPNVLLWGGVLALALPLASRSREALRRGAMVALGLVLAVMPATLRNVAVSHELVLLTSHGGLNFYIGNNPEADGTYHHVAGITPDIQGQIRDARRLAEGAAGRPLTSRQVDAHYWTLGWEWIRDHPSRAMGLFLRKLAYVFSARGITLNYSYAYFSRDEPTLLQGLVVGAWLLVPLGLLGFLERLREGQTRSDTDAPDPFALWVLVVPAYAVSVALFFVSSRYRLPLLVPLAVGSGFALVRLWGWVRERDSRRLSASAAVLVPLVALTFWPHGLDDGRGFARGDEVVRLIGVGQVEEARALLERTLPTHPEAPVLLLRVGRALQAAGRPSEAIPVLERALARAPGRPEVRYTLGQSLLEVGRSKDAVSHLQAAFEAGVRPDLAGFDLARALSATGRRGEAAAILEELLPLELDAESRGTVARLALQLGEPELALKHLDRAVADAPEDGRAHELRGLVLAQAGRAAEARRAFEEAARLDPRSASVHFNLAVLHAQEGHLDAARTAARRALELRPSYAQARALLEQLP